MEKVYNVIIQSEWVCQMIEGNALFRINSLIIIFSYVQYFPGKTGKTPQHFFQFVSFKQRCVKTLSSRSSSPMLLNVLWAPRTEIWKKVLNKRGSQPDLPRPLSFDMIIAWLANMLHTYATLTLHNFIFHNIALNRVVKYFMYFFNIKKQSLLITKPT